MNGVSNSFLVLMKAVPGIHGPRNPKTPFRSPFSSRMRKNSVHTEHADEMSQNDADATIPQDAQKADQQGRSERHKMIPASSLARPFQFSLSL